MKEPLQHCRFCLLFSPRMDARPSRLSFGAASAIYSDPAFAEMSPSSSAVSITSDGNLLVQPEAAAGGSPPGNNMEEAGCVAAAILCERNAYTGPEIQKMWKECNAEGS